MQENTEVQVIRPSFFLWYTSILLLLLVAAGAAWLYTSGVYTKAVIGGIREEITQIDKDISGASLDRKVLIAKIIADNSIRPSLDLKQLISQFRIASAKAGVGLQGFSIQDDTISTSLIATLGNTQVHPDPAATIIAMMRDYAKNDSYFSLDPIYSISGDLTKRMTSIRLKVHSVPQQQ